MLLNHKTVILDIKRNLMLLELHASPQAQRT